MRPKCRECGEPPVKSGFASAYCRRHTDMLESAERHCTPELSDDVILLAIKWQRSLIASLMHASGLTNESKVHMVRSLEALCMDMGARAARQEGEGP